MSNHLKNEIRINLKIETFKYLKIFESFNLSIIKSE